MIATPICDSIVCDRLLVNTCGAAISTSANALHTTQRPMLIGLNSWTGVGAACLDAWIAMAVSASCGMALIESSLPRAQEALGAEHEHQYQEHERQDRRDLADLEFPQRIAE